MKVLRSLQHGSLTITMPDGQTLHVGEDVSPYRAALHIKTSDVFQRAVLFGDIGFAESYIDCEWETDNLTALLKIFLLNVEEISILSGSKRKYSPMNILKFVNRISYTLRKNSKAGSKRNISEHYDLSNDFFSLFLDSSMTYSSAHFSHENESLEDAQREKYDRLYRKLKLKPTDHLLEIGSGWGGFAVHAVKNYGCRVTTVTISREQYEYAKERFKREGVEDRIEIRLQDYRDVTGEFDKIVSIEMLEAVGDEYLETYFRKCHEVLKKNGILAVQVITSPDSRYKEFKSGVDFIQKHIFPGSLLPSIAALNRAVNKSGTMHLHDLKEFGLSYARTLAAWKQRFNKNVEQVKMLGFDDRFIRKWNYYLSYCEAGFATRNTNVVQMVYARPNNTEV
jgi:cyclopropane-fatty-acyl-phospholipid synthase